MKIELVSYSSYCRFKGNYKNEGGFKVAIMRKVLVNSTSDIVVFPCSSILSLTDFQSIVNDPTVTIKAKIVVFEVSSFKKTQEVKRAKSKKPVFDGQGYCYDIKSKQFIINALNQKYATGADLNRWPCLFCEMYDEWKKGLRSFNYDGKRFTILVCGETAMLKCKMVNKQIGPAEFRISSPQASAKYGQIMAGTDVFLNPILTTQGNQGKIKKRREAFSSDGRYYFSNASLEKGKMTAKHLSLQYAVHNGVALQPIPGGMTQTAEYISRVFTI